MGVREGITGVINGMHKPNSALMWAMVGQSLPDSDLYYCLVCPDGQGWEGGGWG